MVSAALTTSTKSIFVLVPPRALRVSLPSATVTGRVTVLKYLAAVGTKLLIRTTALARAELGGDAVDRVGGRGVAHGHCHVVRAVGDGVLPLGGRLDAGGGRGLLHLHLGVVALVRGSGEVALAAVADDRQRRAVGLRLPALAGRVGVGEPVVEGVAGERSRGLGAEVDVKAGRRRGGGRRGDHQRAGQRGRRHRQSHRPGPAVRALGHQRPGSRSRSQVGATATTRRRMCG